MWHYFRDGFAIKSTPIWLLIGLFFFFFLLLKKKKKASRVGCARSALPLTVWNIPHREDWPFSPAGQLSLSLRSDNILTIVLSLLTDENGLYACGYVRTIWYPFKPYVILPVTPCKSIKHFKKCNLFNIFLLKFIALNTVQNWQVHCCVYFLWLFVLSALNPDGLNQIKHSSESCFSLFMGTVGFFKDFFPPLPRAEIDWYCKGGEKARFLLLSS